MTSNSPETLGDFVRRVRKDKNLTLRQVSDRSARFGKRISAGYINHIENDPQRRVTADRLKALADGLGVPVHELLARIMRIIDTIPDYDPDEIRLLAQFKDLSPERRSDVLKIIEVLHLNQNRLIRE